MCVIVRIFSCRKTGGGCSILSNTFLKPTSRNHGKMHERIIRILLNTIIIIYKYKCIIYRCIRVRVRGVDVCIFFSSILGRYWQWRRLFVQNGTKQKRTHTFSQHRPVLLSQIIYWGLYKIIVNKCIMKSPLRLFFFFFKNGHIFNNFFYK